MNIPNKSLTVVLIALAPVLIGSVHSFAYDFHYLTYVPGEVDYWPRWSPDGTKILFSRCDISTGCGGGATTGYWRLFTVPSNGGAASEFLEIDGVSATRSNWLWNSSPLITTPIVFTGVAQKGSSGSGIYVVGTSGLAPTRLPTSSDIPNGYPSWTPYGSAVSVNGSSGGSIDPFIELVGVPNGTGLEQQTQPDQIWTGESAISRDGLLLAFAGQLPVLGSAYNDDLNQIWIQSLIPPDTNPSDFDTGLHQLDPLQGRTPDWSPNDRFLIFESRRGCLNGNYAIFIEAASTGEPIQVTDCKLNANHAVWSPEGRRFAFSAEFFTPTKLCSAGCRGIAVAPVPERILKLGTAPFVRQEIALPGSPFAVTTTPDGQYLFVSMIANQKGGRNGIAIIRQRKPSASLIRVFNTGGDTFGLAMTSDGKYLVDTVQTEDGSAAPEGAQFIDVRKAIAGESGAILATVPTSPQTASSIEVGLSNDNRFAFVSNEYDDTVSVINFKKAIASGGTNAIVGTIPVEHAPVGLAFSGDGRYLYVTNEKANESDPGYNGTVCQIPSGIGNPPPLNPGPYGRLTVVDVPEAEVNPASSVRTSLYAGCSPTRVFLSKDNTVVWVSARDENNLLAFSASAILANAENPLLSVTPVGVAPDGAQPFDHQRFIAVANTNRFYTGQTGTVSILDYAAALSGAGDSGTVAQFPAGAFPRQWVISPNGKYLYLTEFSSDVLAILSTRAIEKGVE